MLKFLEEFGHYLFDFVDKWLFWIGIAMLVGDLLEQKWPAFKAKLDKWLPRRAFGTLAVIFLVLASFQVWHEEYEKTHPGLKLEIVQAGIGDGNTPNDSRILVAAGLRNTGAASIADRWELTVQKEDGSLVKTTTQYLDPSQPITVLTIDGKTIKYSGDDILYNKTMKQPIQTGMKQVGVLTFGLGLPSTAILKKGTKLILQCRDVDDNTIKAEASFNGIHFEPLFYPGMNSPPK